MSEQDRALRVLEFTKIRERLAGYALTDLGKEKCLELIPCVDFSDAVHSLDETEEAVTGPVEEEALLETLWERACAAVELPPEGTRIWKELGRRFGGDSGTVCGSITAAAEELSVLQNGLKEALPGRLRICSAVSMSTAAFLTILLL